MTKKSYIEVAKILIDAKNEGLIRNCCDFDEIVDKFCVFFSHNNERFNKKIFKEYIKERT